MTPRRDVFKHGRNSAADIGRVGLLARLRSWAVSFISPDATVRVTHLAPLQNVRRRDHAQFDPSCKIFQFPGSDQASLRRLAVDMKARFASLGVDDFSPFIFDVDRTLGSRFWIDPVAYVDLLNSQPGFRIVIDDEMFGYMTLETVDFESVHTLVCHYVIACLTARLRNGEAE
ncbi:hypothetical protein [Pseudorhodoplanes sp.]|uniref:hypothetical protein n=1 Tax=Pseudorhodoplanes sp. TaxID=1934341 RepID=UPI002B75C907|nr:hypothetical protein [Pseudorhodoplanes sp.]HWV51682.1 hypothetical protein [Pseudorhodoplanes sp.]